MGSMLKILQPAFWKNQKHLSDLGKWHHPFLQRRRYSRTGTIGSPIINVEESKFDKLLIANRGEIACRIITSAKKMGLQTVSVFSAIDKHAKHVRMADEAVSIGGAKPHESYLNIERMVEAAVKSGAGAVHPGYGFLSENAKFVELLEKENLIFVGPSKEAITKMGDKLESKRLAAEAGVNFIPGYDGVIKDVEHCLAIAESVGYPVMIKATAGGGGMGMRIARNAKEVTDGYMLASSEAQSAFGDNRILLEKYIDNPRHIEIQVLGDKHGNAVHLYERECSIQRRHQKIIEEAPSTFLDEATRRNMGAQAVALCKKIGYYSAGTVEFLVDERRRFYFLEMNTRLQVEHPLTECITGIDLVQQMLRIAQGRTLDLHQNDVPLKGWAIESRVYAEDPCKDFGTPATGRLHKYHEPEGVRVDSGVTEGDEISIYYDPLMAKVITHREDRHSAIKASVNALDTYIIHGVAHNVALLRDTLNEKRFRCGDINTNYLKDVYGLQFPKDNGVSAAEKDWVAAMAGLLFVREERRMSGEPQPTTHWDLLIELPSLSGREFHVQITGVDNNLPTILVGGRALPLRARTLPNGIIESAIGDDKMILQVLYKKPTNFGILFRGTLHDASIIPKRAHDLKKYVKEATKQKNLKTVQSPMPGLVKSVLCEEGQKVLEGQSLCIIEAMKMQNSMKSPSYGRIKKVCVKVGENVSEGDPLIEFH